MVSQRSRVAPARFRFALSSFRQKSAIFQFKLFPKLARPVSSETETRASGMLARLPPERSIAVLVMVLFRPINRF